MSVVANILDQKIEAKRKYARDRARRLRQDPEYRKLELVRNQRWRKDNPENLKTSRAVSNKKWYVKNREEKLAKNKDWKITHPERVNELARRQRAIKLERTIGNPIELAEYEILLAHDPCCYCGEPTEHIDHIVPLARGGTHEWMNLTAACARCNQRKHAKPLLEFLLCL